MNSTQIKCFVSLCKTLNFTQTAKELYLTQPTISKNVHNLEREIGVKLIFHDHRKICLTTGGKEFYKALLSLCNEMDNTIKRIQKLDLSERHTISIGYSGLPFEKQFLPIFIRLMRQKKRWNIELKSINLSQTSFKDQLDNNQIDFMIYQSDFFKESKYIFSPMFRAGFSVIIRRDNPLQKYTKIPLKELNKKIYLWDSKIPLYSVAQLKKALEKSDFSSTYQIKIIHKISLATMLVQADDGIAIVPSFAYDYNNTEVFYRYLDWKLYTSYGLGCLQEKQNTPYYYEVTTNMQKAINLTKEKWNN